MSEIVVKVERIESVQLHPNADRLEIVGVLGWSCVAAKGSFQPGDLCIYFPIDSILPNNLEASIFGADAKVKLNKSRIKTIKLRGMISQGLALRPSSLDLYDGIQQFSGRVREGDDLTARLGVTKYEPPAPPSHMSVGFAPKRKDINSNFAKYTDLPNIKNMPGAFPADEPIYVTEKIHGTNFRAGYVPTEANTLWKRIKKLFRMLPSHEFVYGSRNVQLQDKPASAQASNVYAEMVEKYRLREELHYGLVIYGEIYGDGIQKGYTYGCAPGEHKLVVFDITQNGYYVSPHPAYQKAGLLGLDVVPCLYEGPYLGLDHLKGLTVGQSLLAPSQKVREGVVVRPRFEPLNRRILKVISDEYLLKEQTDFH